MSWIQDLTISQSNNGSRQENHEENNGVRIYFPQQMIMPRGGQGQRDAAEEEEEARLV